TWPSVDITIEIWRRSSSSSRFQILAPCCSPRASIRTAARSGPVSCLVGFGLSCWRPASVATRLSISLEVFFFAAMAMWRQDSRLGGIFVQPGSDNGDGFIRVLVGELADLLHRLGVHLTLDLRDIDHGGGAIGDRDRFVAADKRDMGTPGRGDAAGLAARDVHRAGGRHHDA